MDGTVGQNWTCSGELQKHYVLGVALEETCSDCKGCSFSSWFRTWSWYRILSISMPGVLLFRGPFYTAYYWRGAQFESGLLIERIRYVVPQIQSSDCYTNILQVRCIPLVGSVWNPSVHLSSSAQVTGSPSILPLSSAQWSWPFLGKWKIRLGLISSN